MHPSPQISDPGSAREQHATAKPSRRCVASATLVALAGTILALGCVTAAAEARTQRPDFRLPFACHARAELKTYVGHNPDDKKIDMYRVGMPTGSPILASAAGLVHEQFYPGGIEIDHGNGWFTVYLHMKSHVAPGTQVQRGQQIGIMGNVGTGATHLHYEQLYHAGGHNADNADIVNPLLQGRGPIVMDPRHPITMTSTNCGAAGSSPPPVSPPPPAAPPKSPAPPPPASGHKKYYVNTFEDAPGRRTPGGARTGTLNKGTNYVFCKALGPVVRAGSDFNHWWLKTDLDVGPANQWVSAYYIAGQGNDQANDRNGATIPIC